MQAYYFSGKPQKDSFGDDAKWVMYNAQ